MLSLKLHKVANQSETVAAILAGKMSTSTGVKYAPIEVKLNRNMSKFIGEFIHK